MVCYVHPFLASFVIILDMKLCEKCKTENVDTDAVCKKCGEVLPISSDWVAKMKRNVTSCQTAVGANVCEKNDADTTFPRRDSSSVCWSSTLAAAGATLVVCAFLVEAINCGEVAAFGCAVSSAALVRSFGEKKDDAGIVAGLSLAVATLFLLIRLCSAYKIGN